MRSIRQTLARSWAVWIAVILAGAAGCVENGEPARPPIRDPAYAVGFYNAADANLTDVWARWQSHGIPWGASAGFLPPDPTGNAVGKVSDFQPDPIPDCVELTWKTQDGAGHSQHLAMASKIPDIAHFTGTIYLKYVGPGWKVMPLSEAEMTRRADAGGPLIPPESGDRAPLGDSAARAANAPAVTRPTAGATQQAAERIVPAGHAASVAEKAAIIDALKYLHLSSMRAELLPMGDYCESSDPATQRFIAAASRLSTAAHHLADAVEAKFGKEALGELQLLFPEPTKLLKKSWPEVKESGNPFPAELERASMTVAGDHATVQLGGDALELRKVDGHWKVQIPSLAMVAARMGLAGDLHADADHMARDSRLAAEVDEQLAADVRAGKLQSAAKLGEARSKRQSEIGEKLQKDPDFGLKQQPQGK
jgi:hypothetical protein